MWDAISPYLTALLPTAGILIVVYVVFRTIFEADRKERRAVAQWEAAHPRTDGSASSDDAGDVGDVGDIDDSVDVAKDAGPLTGEEPRPGG